MSKNPVESLTNALLTECLGHLLRLANEAGDADGQQAAGRLAAAMGAKSAAQSKAGGARPGSGRPPVWLAVVDEERGTSYTQNVGALAEMLGLAEASLRVYVNRSGGKHQTTVERDGRTLLLTVRKLSAAETEMLADQGPPPAELQWAPPAELQWAPPAVERRGPGRKKLA